MHNFWDLVAAWDAYLEPDYDVDLGLTEEHLKYQLVLLRGHEEFQKKHEEQYSLIVEGTFANVVATSMARMPNANTVQIEGSIDRPRHGYDPAIILSDMDVLERFITDAYGWENIEGFDGHRHRRRPLELLPAKLLSQLPITIHQAGASIRHLSIGCFPTMSNYLMLCPGEKHLRDPVWDDLHDACQGFASFAIGRDGMNDQPHRDGQILRAKRQYINKFLTTMLSGQGLEDVEVSLRTLGLEDGSTNTKDYYYIGPALRSANWPRIKNVRLRHLSLTQDQVDHFCNGLGDHLTILELASVQLKKGSWAGALDVLRDRLQTRSDQKECQVWLPDIYDGEFGQPEVNPNPRYGFLEALEKTDWDLVAQSEKYLLGDEYVAKNPLREGDADVLDQIWIDF
ncbi:hypothetical protein PT974_05432 [Cladobotryum mycophilum]|uniref:Uncharacterized protein n=1 Tax=Cladobotryum mycophilum TaxID=491253 RepID=A0ABR0SIQ1_9HYPO